MELEFKKYLSTLPNRQEIISNPTMYQFVWNTFVAGWNARTVKVRRND